MVKQRHRLRILIVTRNLPPLVGGMERLNWHMIDELRRHAEVRVIGPSGAAKHAPQNVEIHEAPLKPLSYFLLKALWLALRQARQWHPDVVLAGSGLTAPIAWLAARCSGAKAIVYLHGLDVVAPNRLYQWLWLPFIRRCDMVLVNSANTAQLAVSRRVQFARLHVLHPGTEMPMLEPTTGLAFRQQFDLGERPLLLSVGRLTQRKGLAEFVTRALPIILVSHPDALLVVIGEEAIDALHSRAGSERERILASARSAGTDKCLRFLGRCDEATLGAAYQACDIHIFPVLTLPGDVEGFGMVALEAAAHGLPTVAFAVGGVPDAVQNGFTGTLVQPGDYAALGDAVTHQLTRARDTASIAACREFAAGKAWPVFGQHLRDLLDASHD
jgi:phosphatidylinositol alpha-1,6-mannosyltransferase